MGHLIVVEGIDGSGKNTQTNLLIARLRATGLKADTLSFPRYQQSFFGAEVGNYLNGTFGSMDSIHPKLPSLLYAGDRFEAKPELLEMLSANDVVICDRYTSSNAAHQTAKIKDPIKKQEFLDWLDRLEYEVYGLPRPTATIFLSVPPVHADELVELKPKRRYTDKVKDMHEADRNYLVRVYEQYISLAQTLPRWHVLDCANGDKLRSIDAISDDLFLLVNSVISS